MKAKKFLFIALLVIAVIVTIPLIKTWTKYMNQTSNFILPDNFESIYSCCYSNKLSVIVKGEIYLYDENEDYRIIKTPFNVAYVSMGNEKFLIIDDNNNLYEYDINNQIISDVILTDIKTCSVGDNYYGAVTNSGKLYMWGDNQYGQLGINREDYIDEPICIDYVNNIDEVVCGYTYTLLRTTDGNVLESGGDYGDNNLYRFTSILKLRDVQHIFSGGYGNLAVDREGIVTYWWNRFDSDISNPMIDTNENIANNCVKSGVKNFSFGGSFNLGINELTGEVYYWGNDIVNKTRGKSILYIHTPTKISDIECDAIYAGNTVAYLKENNKIFVIR